MATQRSVEIRVGLFVIVCLAVGAGLIWQFGKLSPASQQRYPLVVMYDNVGGLIKDANVMYAGVTIGKVRAIELVTDVKLRARVTLAINEGIQVPADSKFVINQSGLLGDRYVDVLPGSPKVSALKPGAVVEGTPSVDLTEAIRSVVEVLQQAASTMRRVDQLIAHADDVVLQVGGTLRRVDGAVTRVDDIILSTQNLQHVTCTFANIEASSSNAVAVTASLRALLDEGRNSVTNTLNKLSAAADNLNGTLRRVDGVVAGAEPDVRASLKNLADSTGKVNAILDKLEKSDGTVGKLMNDPALHDELLRLVRNLREHGLFYREGPSKSGGPTTEPKRGKAPVPSRPAKETGPDTKPGEPHEERP